MKTKRYFYTIISIIIFIIFGYWLKCQLGMDISNSIHPSNYIPFKYLTKNTVIDDPKPGELITESFDGSKWILNNWSELWMAEKGKVTQEYDKNGTNNSQALLIKSKSSKSWAYTHTMFIQAKPGDNFSFEGFVKSDGKTTTAYLGVASFDVNKKIIDYSYVKKKVNKSKMWTKVNEHFKVSDGIEYIQLRLTGSGIGEFRFDDIKLIKE